MIVVPNDCRAVVAAFGPIATRRVAARRGVHPLRVRAGEHIVGVHRVDAAGHDFAFLGEGAFLVEIGVS